MPSAAWSTTAIAWSHAICICRVIDLTCLYCSDFFPKPNEDGSFMHQTGPAPGWDKNRKHRNIIFIMLAATYILGQWVRLSLEALSPKALVMFKDVLKNVLYMCDMGVHATLKGVQLSHNMYVCAVCQQGFNWKIFTLGMY